MTNTEPDGGLVVGDDGLARCWWAAGDPLYRAYHDVEWGRPQRDEGALFEKLCLEGFQAGLSWLLVLRRRPALRDALAGFDPHRVARFDEDDVTTALDAPGMIRNRAKVQATVGNARALLDLQGRGESLSDLAWSHRPVPTPPPPRTVSDVPAITPESTAFAAALKRRGFRFVGPTIAYAFMQAMGLVNDHLVDCHTRDRHGGDAPTAAGT